jgi:hypothetical protein
MVAAAAGLAPPTAVAREARPTPETGVKNERPKVLMTPDEVREREALLLPNDTESTEKAVSDTAGRLASGRFDGSGTILSNAELALFEQREDRSRVLEEYFASSPSAFSWYRLGHDLSNPSLELRADLPIGGAEVMSAAKAIEAIVRLPLTLVPSRYRREDRLRFAEAFDKANADGLRSIGPVAELGRDQSVRVLGLSYDADDEKFFVEVDEATPAKDDDSFRMAASDSVRKISQLDDITVDVRYVGDHPASGRYESPGQAKGGIELSGCTSAFSVRHTTGDKYLVTAGHCIDNGQGVGIRFAPGQQATHNGSSIGVASSCLSPVATAWCSLVSNADIGLVRLTPANRASEYTLSQTGGVPFQRPLVGVDMSTTSSANIWYCIEPSSSQRLSLPAASPLGLNTSCNWGASALSVGFGQATIGLCGGDSGALVRDGSYMIRGVLRGYNGGAFSANCGWSMFFTFAQRLFANIGNLTALVANPSSTATNPYPNLNTRAQLKSAFLYAGTTPLCISADGSLWANTTLFLQWACIAGHHAQSFGLVPATMSGGYSGGGVTSDDVYRVVRYDGSNRSCLSINRTAANGNGMNDQTGVINWDCVANYDAAQLWRIESMSAPGVSGQQFRLISMWNNKCLDVPFGSTGLGTVLWTYTCVANNPNNVWRLE